MLFSGARDLIPEPLLEPLHLGTYVLLFWFAFANFRNLILLPLFLGMALNAIAILSNGGRMPVNQEAWESTGLDGAAHSNVAVGADRLAFLGDIFALPRELPLANVFSIGDLLLGIGTVMLIVTVSTTETSRPALSPSRLLDPLRTPSFRRLASGKLLSQLGDWLTVAALVGWIYETTGSVSQVAALLVIRLAPPVLGSGLAAAVVDRFPRQRLLVLVEVGRGLLVAAALAAIVFDVPLVAFAAIAGSGLLSAVSSATVRALVPSILERQQFAAGNAVLGFAQDGAMALGALAAGIALTTTTAAVALSLRPRHLRLRRPALLGRAGQSAGVRRARPRRWLPPGPPLHPPPPAPDRRDRRLRHGHARDRPDERDPAAASSARSSASGRAPTASASRRSPAASRSASAVTGLAPVGEMSGRWIGVALLMMASLFGVLALTDHAPTALVLLGMIGFLDGTTDVLFDTIVQREVDPAYYGRVFGLGSALFTTTMMGAVALAPVANGFGAPHSVIFVAAGGLLVAAIVALVGTRRPSASIPAAPGRIALDTRP